MSVSITVTWKLLDDPEVGFTCRIGEVPLEELDQPHPLPVQAISPDKVLELSSSSLAPGLSMQVA